MIYESGNGGELSLVNGDIEMIDGISNQPYLAHFGGNIEASTTGEEIEGEERKDWFGNVFLLNNPGTQMNSELERSMNENSLNSSGRSKIENAAKNDLSYLSDTAKVDSKVSVTGVDKVLITDTINELKANFQWDASKSELIEEITI